MAAVTICSDFGVQENKVCHCFHIYMSWSDVIRCHDLSFLNSSFKPAFHSPLSPSLRGSLVLHFCRKGGIISILRLWIFLPAILIPACPASSPALHITYFACNLNKQGDNIQLWRTLFQILNQSTVTCSVLSVASWPAHGFLGRQVRWSGIPISWRTFHSWLWSTQSKALA